MDQRLIHLLNVGGCHLAKIVNNINALGFEGNALKPIAFLYPPAETSPMDEVSNAALKLLPTYFSTSVAKVIDFLPACFSPRIA